MKFFSLDLFGPGVTKNIYALALSHRLIRKTGFLFLIVLPGVFFFSGCQKKGSHECKGLDNDKEFVSSSKGLLPQTLCELQEARLATEKYRNLSKAIEDGYADISVVIPNMGYHYMKSAFVDSTFEVGRPEILVYNKSHDGSFELIAVEYAVPISLSPDQAPEGFTGDADVWDHNTGFGLWLLHAWVWQSNPSGVFNATNPGVHVH